MNFQPFIFDQEAPMGQPRMFIYQKKKNSKDLQTTTYLALCLQAALHMFGRGKNKTAAQWSQRAEKTLSWRCCH